MIKAPQRAATRPHNNINEDSKEMVMLVGLKFNGRVGTVKAMSSVYLTTFCPEQA